MRYDASRVHCSASHTLSPESESGPARNMVGLLHFSRRGARATGTSRVVHSDLFYVQVHGALDHFTAALAVKRAGSDSSIRRHALPRQAFSPTSVDWTPSDRADSIESTSGARSTVVHAGSLLCGHSSSRSPPRHERDHHVGWSWVILESATGDGRQRDDQEVAGRESRLRNRSSSRERSRARLEGGSA